MTEAGKTVARFANAQQNRIERCHAIHTSITVEQEPIQDGRNFHPDPDTQNPGTAGQNLDGS